MEMSTEFIKNRLKSLFKQGLTDHLPQYNKSIIKRDVRYLGANLQIGKFVRIQHPELCILGENVSIGERTSLKNLGGIVVADGCKIGANVTFGGDLTTMESLPIVLGQQCVIEDNATLSPGTILEDGTILSKDGTTKVKDLERPKDYDGEGLFFVVSTGGAGSKSVAKILAEHPDISCRHEPNTLLISLSTNYAHGKIDRTFLKNTLAAIYCKSSIFKGKVVGESDQKLGNLIPILTELLPESKFIWIKRNAYDFVQSAAYNKHWYSENRTEQVEMPFLLQMMWVENRLNGARCNAVETSMWENMNIIEKNAWYWDYWNGLIENSLAIIPQGQTTKLKLESLEDSLQKLPEFLQVSNHELSVRHENKSPNQTTNKKLSEEDRKLITKICASKMKKWYPDLLD